MRGPAHDGVEDDALKGERPVGIVTNGIAQVMGVAGAVAEVVAAVVLMHPTGFKEAVWVVGGQRLSVCVNDLHGTRRFGELQHVVGHPDHTRRQRGFLALRQVFVFEHLIVVVPLQLSAPDAAEEGVHRSVVVLEQTRVDGIGAADGVGLRYERSLGSVGDGDAEAEHTIVVFSAVEQVVTAVFLHDVVVPQLLLSPWHVLHAQDDTVVGDVAVHDVVE